MVVIVLKPTFGLLLIMRKKFEFTIFWLYSRVIAIFVEQMDRLYIKANKAY